MECEAEGTRLRVIQQGPEHRQVLETELPCVVTFTNPGFDVRYPTVKRKLAAGRAVIPEVSPAELEGIDLGRCGLKGSPTRVKTTFVPVHNKNGVIVREETGEQSARKLAGLLSEAGIV